MSTHHNKTYFFGGSGAAFLWQLGYGECLLKHPHHQWYAENAHFKGRSAGALVATVFALKLDPKRAIDLANEAQNKVKGRPFGLIGIWRELLREVYDTLLPNDIDYTKVDNLSIELTDEHRQTQDISRFESKEDLIGALLATQHIPYVLNYRRYANFRGERFQDIPNPNAPSITGPQGQQYNICVPFKLFGKGIKPWQALTRKSDAKIHQLRQAGAQCAARHIYASTTHEPLEYSLGGANRGAPVSSLL